MIGSELSLELTKTKDSFLLSFRLYFEKSTVLFNEYSLGLAKHVSVWQMLFEEVFTLA